MKLAPHGGTVLSQANACRLMKCPGDVRIAGVDHVGIGSDFDGVSAKGCTLYMVKAVMSGRGDEVLELAVTNLWR
jgi:hypothetical protein